MLSFLVQCTNRCTSKIEVQRISNRIWVCKEMSICVDERLKDLVDGWWKISDIQCKSVAEDVWQLKVEWGGRCLCVLCGSGAVFHAFPGICDDLVFGENLIGARSFRCALCFDDVTLNVYFCFTIYLRF